MTKVKFTIPGPPVGYVSTTHKAKISKAYLRFAEYAKIARMYARAAGIKIPLSAVKDRPLTIRTVSYFKNGVHPDPGNVQKGVVDALFYDEERAAMAKIARRTGKGRRGTGKGDDKHTGGSFPPPLYDKENPRVVVIIKDHLPLKEDNNGQEEKKKQGTARERAKRSRSKTKAKTTEKSKNRA